MVALFRRELLLHPNRSVRMAWLVACFLVLLFPLLGMFVLNSSVVGQWLSTGICPGGPMDRPARPCGLFELSYLVFFGGWAAFVVIPLFVLWWLICLLVLLAAVSFMCRPARCHGASRR